MYRDSRRTRVVLALLILTSFTLITVDYRSGDGTVLRNLRTGAAAVFGPVQRAVTSVVRPIGNALSTLGDLGSLNDQVKDLQAENAELRNQLHQLDDLRRENDELRRLNDLAAKGGYKTVRCRVVAVGPVSFEWTATVDCGSRDGIKVDHTVLNADGLVGKVVDVAPWTAQVLLAIDPEFTVIGRQAGHGTTGPVTGNGLQPMEMQLLDPAARVATGEAIVSQGVQGGIVAGVPIGVVSAVSRERSAGKVSVKPFVRFSALDVVAVVVEPPRRDPRDSLVPAPPSPSPSPRPTVRPVTPACPTGSPASRSPGEPSPSPCPSPSLTPTPPPTFGPPSPSRTP